MTFITDETNAIVDDTEVLLLVFFTFVLLIVIHIVLLPSFPPLFFYFPNGARPALFYILRQVRIFPSI